MFIFEKNPKNIKKPVEYSPTYGRSLEVSDGPTYIYLLKSYILNFAWYDVGHMVTYYTLNPIWINVVVEEVT